MDFTQISDTNQENKEKENKIYTENSSDTTATTNTINTIDTTATFTNLYHLYPVSQTSQEIFGESLLDLILRHFYATNNAPITFANLGEKLGQKKESLRSAVNRVKELFHDTGSKGRAGMIQVGEKGVEEIESRINQLLTKKQQKEHKIMEERAKLTKLEEIQENIFTFIRLHKPERKGRIIYLNFDEILDYDPGLADYFLENSEDFLKVFSGKFEGDFSVQIINLPNSSSLNIEEIRKEQLNKIIAVEGRVTSFGEVKPLITEIMFECPSCGTIISKTQNYRTGQLEEPKRCSCGRRGGFFESNRKEVNSCFVQLEDLQDKTDNPHSQRIKAVLFNGLTNFENIKKFSPGNEVKCVGLLKEVPVFKNNKKTVFLNWILEIISAELIEKDVEVTNFSEDDNERINELSAKIDSMGLDPLLDSFAPEVYGYNEIKGAMALQLCNRRNDKKAKSTRNKSNILLIGDPGVAKSVLCDFAVDITAGSRKAVGGGSSAVGITASVMKEEDSLGGYRVEPGALILAKDLLFLDELNNLSDDDKPKLQEGMNEQTVSINKANIHVKMKVTCGMIAVANPKSGHFIDDPNKPLSEQFNIPSPILNRFDSVFVVRDVVNTESDKKIAEKMIRRHRGELNPEYDKDFLRKFFAYIKIVNEPDLGEEAESRLKEVYADVRKLKNTGVKINPRFLESLTRMSISTAKLRQSNIIEKKDVDRALSILSKSQYDLNKL